MVLRQSNGGVRLVALLLAVLLFSSQFRNVQIAATFDPDRLRLVDASCCGPDRNEEVDLATCAVMTCQQPHVLLVRGNAPLNAKGKFDAPMLITAIQDRIRRLSSNDELSSNNLNSKSNNNVLQPKLVVVSLLSSRPNDEAAVLRLEREGIFDATDSSLSSPTVGLIHSPIEGSWWALLPKIFHRWIPHTTFVDGTGGAWDLATRLHALVHDNSNDSEGTNTIVYFHCMRGMDRTGLLAGAYAMRFQQKSLRDVQEANREVAKRPLNLLEERSLLWSHARLGAKYWETSSISTEDLEL